MMKRRIQCALALLMLVTLQASAACGWPAWQQFKKSYISDGGRVIDPGDARKITTSEGQSYAMFFALAANDRKAFASLFSWTQNNLAAGNLQAHLPAWLWGGKTGERWAVLDGNSASDADTWIAWSLLEAGRLWNMPHYSATGKALLTHIASEEVVNVPGLGVMLLPGNVGFVDDSGWRFNPSYLPPQLAAYFARFGEPWKALQAANLRLLLETAPQGYSPNWVRFDKQKGWQLKQDTALTGSYDAIRVYLWVGMLSDADPQKALLLEKFKAMENQTAKAGVVPEKIAIATGKIEGDGPVGFSAALLPFLQHRDAQAVQRQRVADHFPGNNAYYSYVLTLFGQGWDQHRFRFTAHGELLPDWNLQCVPSH